MMLTLRWSREKKKLPHKLQESLTAVFAKNPVSSFPQVPGGKVTKIDADTSIGNAVKILSQSNIQSAPVMDPAVQDSNDKRERYLGILEYCAIVLWVLESAEIEAKALSANSEAVAGTGVCAASALGALAMSATATADPAIAAGLAVAAVGAAVTGGVAAERVIGKDAPTAVDKLGEDFYEVIFQEPFKSTTVRSIIESYRWLPFVPVATDSSMLTVMLLLSKYRLRSVPMIETGKPFLKNLITQSAVIRDLEECKGRDSCIRPWSSLHVIIIQIDELILEVFKKMRDNNIGGLPVVQGPKKQIVAMQLTVKDFTNTVASATHEPSETAPVTCKLHSTFGNVIDILASKSVHRTYVTTAQDNVVGVITLRDVISCFIFEPPNFFDNYFGFCAQEMFGG